MKKEDLVALGLTEETIAEIQKLNGLDIKKEQDKLAKVELERDNYKGQLETTQAALKEFEGIDVNNLKGEIDKLNNAIKEKDVQYQKDLADRDFNALLDGQISSVGARNAKAVKALLDVEALKGSKNQTEDIKAAIEAVKSENDFLFGSDEPINKPVRPTNSNTLPVDTGLSALRAAMGLKPEQ